MRPDSLSMNRSYFIGKVGRFQKRASPRCAGSWSSQCSTSAAPRRQRASSCGREHAGVYLHEFDFPEAWNTRALGSRVAQASAAGAPSQRQRTERSAFGERDGRPRRPSAAAGLCRLSQHSSRGRQLNGTGHRSNGARPVEVAFGVDLTSWRLRMNGHLRPGLLMGRRGSDGTRVPR
jgi:hypothetical protein